MENKRGSEIFLGVVGVTTLLVAIIGATFAYFSATAKSGNEAVAVQSTKVDLGYDDVTNRLKTKMIPAAYNIAKFAAFDERHDKGECIDDNGNQVCSIYEFYIGNPGQAKMDIEGSVNVVTNEFTNLRFQILDEKGTVVFPVISGKAVGVGTDNLPGEAFPATGGSIELDTLTQSLLGTPEGNTPSEEDKPFPSKYTPIIDVTNEDVTSEDITDNTNVRHYTMLIWLNETGAEQDEDGKIFTAGISFSTGGESGGVTGIIAAANEA